jgi:hypothetical protein
LASRTLGLMFGLVSGVVFGLTGKDERWSAPSPRLRWSPDSLTAAPAVGLTVELASSPGLGVGVGLAVGVATGLTAEEPDLTITVGPATLLTRSEVNYAIYRDRYQRTPGGWRFTERVYEVRYRDQSPLSGSAPRPAGRGHVVGGRATLTSRPGTRFWSKDDGDHDCTAAPPPRHPGSRRPVHACVCVGRVRFADCTDARPVSANRSPRHRHVSAIHPFWGGSPVPTRKVVGQRRLLGRRWLSAAGVAGVWTRMPWCGVVTSRHRRWCRVVRA